MLNKLLQKNFILITVMKLQEMKNVILNLKNNT